MTNYREEAGRLLCQIRSAKPVVHSITNYVVMNSTANVLLAMGAAPIMAHAKEEIDEIVRLAGSVVINIGTLSKDWIESMVQAAALCQEIEKPYVLDPVGAGATKLRSETAMRLIRKSRPSVIRGNASEILALSRAGGDTRGVDSVNTVDQAADAARELALMFDTVVAVTGPEDLVTDGRVSLTIKGGHALMGCVTGTGCAATAIVGAFIAQTDDFVEATAAALAYFGLAGEKAAFATKGPGTYWPKVIDALYNIKPEELAKEAKIERA